MEQEHPDIRSDLNGASLSGAELSVIDLIGSNRIHDNLSNADLRAVHELKYADHG